MGELEEFPRDDAAQRAKIMRRTRIGTFASGVLEE
jgi:hypothetical protein